MTKKPQLDKIIGSSPISQNTFDIHYSSSVCAFPSHGYLSIINIHSHQRSDIQISQNFRSISALKFSINENQIAVGESGINSKIFILAFNNSFDQVISKMEIHTKENGFSCLAYDSKKGKLISVGVDSQPFLILWDLNHPNPIKLGYYHLSTQPSKVLFNSDCSLVIVSGDGILKLIQTNFPYENKPIPMKSKRANFDTYTDSNFVDIYCTKGSTFNLYALCYEGTLCFYQGIDNPFRKRSKSEKAALVLTPIKLSRGNLTSLIADDTIILCGGEKGTIFAFKNQNDKLKVAGKLVAIPKSVISVGISEQYITSTYQDGHLLFWKKEDVLQMANNGKQVKNILPEITIYNHRGPICKILVIKSTGQIVSCGSDNSVRLWEIHKQQEFISKSSQEMVNYRQFGPLEPSFIDNYFGVRSVTYLNGLLIAGLNDGIVHILKIDTFEEIMNFIDSIDAVTALASLENKSFFASGSGDGTVRLYSIEKKDDDEIDYTLISSREAFSNTITSLIFIPSSLVATSQNGVKFFSLPSLEEISFFETSEPILCSTYIEKADLIAAGGCDCNVYLFDSKSGRLFNRFTLSNNYYPVTIDSHESGFVLAVAMSDGNVLVVDIITGEPIYSFDPSMGVITSISFHESDLIIASFSGCIARWNLPESFHKEVEKQKNLSKQSSPVLLDLLDSLPAPPSTINANNVGIEEEETDESDESKSQNDEDEEDDDYDDDQIKQKSSSILDNSKMKLRSSFIAVKVAQKCEYENDQNQDDVLNTEKSITNEKENNDDDDNEKPLNKDSSESLIGDIEAPRPPLNSASPDSIIRSSICSRKLLTNNGSKLIDKSNEEKESDQPPIIEILSIPETRPKRKPIPLDFGPADSLKSHSPSPSTVLSLNNKSQNAKNDQKIEDNSIKPLNPEEVEDITGNFMVDSSSSDENENNNENENDKKEIKESKVDDEHDKMANEIKETAIQLQQCLEKAKELLNENLTDDDDIQAQQHLRNLLDSFNTVQIRKNEIGQRMKEASQKLLELSSQAEKMSANALQLISSFPNE